MRASSFALILSATVLVFTGCQGSQFPSSVSVDQARARSLFVAEYAVPKDADLGEYRVLEVWVETWSDSDEQRLVIRLDGPHVDIEPRVQVAGLNKTHYRSIWSRRDGPPYEVWAAPNPLPGVLSLKRGEKQVKVIRRWE